MIFNNPQLLTKLEIWTPRYHDKKDGEGEWIALLAQYKVDQASPWIRVEFTKAKHLMGQRFCIKRSTVQECKLDSNSKIPCYAVPMSLFENWDSTEDVKNVINNELGW